VLPVILSQHQHKIVSVSMWVIVSKCIGSAPSVAAWLWASWLCL
jgi:hypothetical protein